MGKRGNRHEFFDSILVLPAEASPAWKWKELGTQLSSEDIENGFLIWGL